MHWQLYKAIDHVSLGPGSWSGEKVYIGFAATCAILNLHLRRIVGGACIPSFAPFPKAEKTKAIVVIARIQTYLAVAGGAMVKNRYRRDATAKKVESRTYQTSGSLLLAKIAGYPCQTGVC